MPSTSRRLFTNVTDHKDDENLLISKGNLLITIGIALLFNIIFV